MAYLRRGLYRVRRQGGSKMIAHDGILDIGNCLRRYGGSYFAPVVVHQSPPGIQIDSLHDFGPYKIVRTIHDVDDAIQRFNLALQNPEYDLFANNCEHFAGYVATGRRESGQLQGAVVLAGLAVFIMAAVSSGRVRPG